MPDKDVISKLSSHLFWDTDQSTVSWEKHTHFLVSRVLEYGKLEDWLILKNALGLPEIARVCAELRYLDEVSLNFIATLTNKPKEEFRCYTLRQSMRERLSF